MAKVATELAENVLASPTDLLGEDFRQLVLSLKETKLPWFRRNRYVMRTLAHTLSWARGYVETEAKELDSEFVSDTKGYHIVVILPADASFLSIVFRLTTQGLDGWTQYGIKLRKANGFYACEE